MKTVGTMLAEARRAKGLTLLEVEKRTKIRSKFIDAIEHDQYDVLPSLIYAKGFVKNYSEFLGLDSNTVMAFFRRQTEFVSRASILPHRDDANINISPFRLTPGKFILFLVAACIGLFFLYFGLQVRRINLPPALTIVEPKPDSLATSVKIDVAGKTDTDATLSVNGISVLVKSDGSFFDQINLTAGINSITVASTSRFGKTTTKTLQVGLQQ